MLADRRNPSSSYLWNSSDLPDRIFKGQILTVAIVIGLLAVFLLREWIFQNAGPGPTQEVENEAVPKPEEFQMQMRAKWRQRRLRNLDHRDPPVDVVFNRNQGRAPFDFRAGHLQPRPALDRHQQDLLRAELIEHFMEPQAALDATPTEEEQWVDEEDWVDNAANAGHLSDSGIQGGFEHPEIGGNAPIFQQENRDEQAESVVEEPPRPSLLQQLRQQHREHADSNMSFEEFLAHSRSDITDPSGSAGLKTLPRPNESELSTSADLSEGNHMGAGRKSPENWSTAASRGEATNSQDSLKDDYHRYFMEPAEIEDDQVERPDGYRALVENDRLRRQGAVRDLERPRGAIERNPRPRRPRNVLNEAEIVVAVVDADEEVEMGPEPDLDDEEADEGGLMIDGDIDGILEGAPQTIL